MPRKTNANTKSENTVAINVIRTEVPYSTLRRFVNFVVELSIDATSGDYHEYLKDYAETLAILMMYTDFEDPININTDQLEFEQRYDNSFNTVMSIANSEEYKNKILLAIGNQYDVFHKYVDSEVKKINSPFYKLEGIGSKLKTLVDNVVEVVNAIDIEKLKEADFSQLAEAANQLENA